MQRRLENGRQTWPVWVLGFTGLMVAAWILSHTGLPQIGLVAVVLAALAFGLLAGRFRIRETVIWFALLVAAFNFAPVLFNAQSLNSQSLVTRIVKDVPLVLCFIVAIGTPGRQPSKLLLPVLALAIVVCVEALAIPQPVTAAFASVRYYVLYPALAVAVSRMDLTAEERGRVLRLIVVLGVIEGCIAVLEFFGYVGHAYNLGSATIGVAHVRAIATLGNPNNLGLFLTLSALVLFAAIDSYRLLKPVTAIIALVPVLAGIATTLSKGVAVGLAIALLLQTKRVRGKARILLVLVMVGGFLYFAIHGRAESTSQLLGSRPATNESGFREYTATTLRVLFGEGIGSQQQLVGNDVVSNVTDNMVLTMGLEGGLLLLFVFGFAVWTSIRILQRMQGLEACLLGYGVYFLLFTLIYTNFRLYPASFLFWMAIGLAETSSRDQAAVERDEAYVELPNDVRPAHATGP